MKSPARLPAEDHELPSTGPTFKPQPCMSLPHHTFHALFPCHSANATNKLLLLGLLLPTAAYVRALDRQAGQGHRVLAQASGVDGIEGVPSHIPLALLVRQRDIVAVVHQPHHILVLPTLHTVHHMYSTCTARVQPASS